jgi:uncharacterized SAM-binding protein YcdF (DUF218 family)
MKKFAIGVVALIIGAAVAAAVVFFGLGYYLSPQGTLAKADAIVAISGGDTDARTDEAVRLYRAGWSHHLIFSGAALDPNSPSNAQVMATRATHQGIPASAITLDEAATDTRENAADVAAIARKQGYTSLILVTSPYHQRRADIVFRRALGSGITIINHSTVDQTWRRSHWWATAYSRNLTLSELQKVIYELLNDPTRTK